VGFAVRAVVMICLDAKGVPGACSMHCNMRRNMLGRDESPLFGADSLIVLWLMPRCTEIGFGYYETAPRLAEPYFGLLAPSSLVSD
jgi:hypothetical protein